MSEPFHLAPRLTFDGREIVDLGKKLEALPKDTWPKAIAVSLTDSANEARDDLREQIRKKLIIRKKWVLGGVISQAAEKDDRPVQALVGILQDRAFLADHFTGKVRKAGKYQFAIPHAARKKPEANITKSNRPEELLQKKAFVGEEGGKTHILQEYGPKRLITKGKHKGEKRRRVKLMYLLRDKVEIQKQMDFHQEVEASVARTFERHFTRRAEKILKGKR